MACVRLLVQPENMATQNSLDAASWLADWQKEADAGHLSTAAASQPPTLSQLEAIIEARVKDAYDAALRKLARQHQALLSTRSQATGVLTVGTLITSLVVGLGFLKTSASAEPVFPTWARWSLFAILLFMIALHVVISWPVKQTYGASPEGALWTGENPPEGPIRKSLVGELIGYGDKNEKHVKLCARLYQTQALALVAEVIVIIIATLRG